MNKENIIKFIFMCLVISFLVILFSQKTEYYQKKLTQSKILTEEQIKKFEKDVEDGKNVDLIDYVIDENKDYTSDLSNNVYNVSLKLEKTIDKIIKFIFNEMGKVINN